MKKIIFILMMFVSSIASFAQPSFGSSVVYFDELDSKVQIGLGYSFDKKSRIFSIIQKSNKNFDHFGIEIQDNDYIMPFLPDTIMQINKYYECDYTISNEQFYKLMQNLNGVDYVYINGRKYKALEVKRKLEAIEYEATHPSQPVMIFNGPRMRPPHGISHPMFMVRFKR